MHTHPLKSIFGLKAVISLWLCKILAASQKRYRYIKISALVCIFIQLDKLICHLRYIRVKRAKISIRSYKVLCFILECFGGFVLLFVFFFLILVAMMLFKQTNNHTKYILKISNNLNNPLRTSVIFNTNFTS